MTWKNALTQQIFIYIFFRYVCMLSLMLLGNRRSGSFVFACCYVDEIPVARAISF